MKPFSLPNSSRPLLGAHTSVAGGLHNALKHGSEIGADVVQIFSKNQLQWKGRPLRDDALRLFFRAVEETGIIPATIHDSYLINLATRNSEVWKKSFAAFKEELIRAEQLRVPYLVMHPGSHLNQGEAQGIRAVAESLDRAIEETGVTHVRVLLETTAGQGSNLGYTFEQLRDIMGHAGKANQLGVCLDTCHIFAAGYEVRSARGWNKTLTQFERVIGLKKLCALHLNDSRYPLGSRRDRHARIGQGEIGLKAFGIVLNDSRMAGLPMILEVPGGNEAYKQDLSLLRSLFNS